MKKNNFIKKSIIVVSFIFSSVSLQAIDYVDVKNSDGNTIFKLEFYQPSDGELKADPVLQPYFTTDPGTWRLTQDYENLIIDAMQYYTDVLKPHGSIVNPAVIPVMTFDKLIDEVGHEASAIGFTNPATLKPNVEDCNNCKLIPNLLINTNEAKNFKGYATLIKLGDYIKEEKLSPERNVPNGLNTPIGTMIHEITHALGFLSMWDDPGMNPPENDTNFGNLVIKNPVDGKLYFSGNSAALVYGDGISRLIPMDNSHPDEDQVSSHLGLPAILMNSGYNGTFYNAPSELEMAMLNDIGYNIDIRNFYGKSIYTNNNNNINTQGFFARKDGNYILGDPNLSTFAIGLHVYGDNNNVIQRLNLLANGKSAAGIRNDGSNNKITIEKGVRVTANGYMGTGVLINFGHDNVLVNKGSIEANDETGIGVIFNAGGFKVTSHTSYNKYTIKDEALPEVDPASQVTMNNALDGPLVKEFDISGSVAGKEQAILVNKFAHVKNINILNGANIKGDIITYYYTFPLRGPLVNQKLFTDLNFGLLSNPDGTAIYNTEDKKFKFSFDDKIVNYGNARFNINTYGGVTSLNNYMNVRDININNSSNLSLNSYGIVAENLTLNEDATLSGTSVIKINDKVILSGTISPDNVKFGNNEIGRIYIVASRNDVSGYAKNPIALDPNNKVPAPADNIATADTIATPPMVYLKNATLNIQSNGNINDKLLILSDNVNIKDVTVNYEIKPDKLNDPTFNPIGKRDFLTVEGSREVMINAKEYVPNMFHEMSQSYLFLSEDIVETKDPYSLSFALDTKRNSTPLALYVNNKTAKSLANALEHSNSPIYSNILILKPTDNVSSVFNTLGGKDYPVMFNALDTFDNLFIQRLKDETNKDDKVDSFWFNANNANTPLKDNKLTNNSVSFGFKESSDNLIANLAFGFGKGKFDGDYLKANINSYDVGMYLSQELGNFALSIGGIYANNKIDGNRNVSLPYIYENLTSKYITKNYQVFSDLAYRVDLNRVKISPNAGLYIGAKSMSGFKEEGGISALNFNKTNYSLFGYTLGVDTKVDITNKLNFNLNLGYIGDLKNNPELKASISKKYFDIYDEDYDKNMITLGSYLDYKFKTFHLSLGYNGLYNKNAKSHNINLNFRWNI